MKKAILIATCIMCFTIQASTYPSTSINPDSLNTDYNNDIDFPGKWSRYINSKNNSRFTAMCDRLDNISIKCSFNRLRINHDETEIIRLKKQLDEIERKNQNEIQSVISKFKKECPDPAKLSNAQKKSGINLKNDDAQNIATEFKKTCDAPTKDNLIHFINLLISREKQTCTIYENQYTSIFKYNTKTGKWISQEKPYGPCGIIAIEYFTKDPRNGFKDFAWHYTLQQIITNKEGDGTMGVKCSELANEDETSYGIGTFLYENDGLMNCKYIDLANVI